MTRHKVAEIVIDTNTVELTETGETKHQVTGSLKHAKFLKEDTVKLLQRDVDGYMDEVNNMVLKKAEKQGVIIT